jgi:hypothetical protein
VQSRLAQASSLHSFAPCSRNSTRFTADLGQPSPWRLVGPYDTAMVREYAEDQSVW